MIESYLAFPKIQRASELSCTMGTNKIHRCISTANLLLLEPEKQHPSLLVNNSGQVAKKCVTLSSYCSTRHSWTSHNTAFPTQPVVPEGEGFMQAFLQVPLSSGMGGAKSLSLLLDS